jgi:hypothetical protein
MFKLSLKEDYEHISDSTFDERSNTIINDVGIENDVKVEEEKDKKIIIGIGQPTSRESNVIFSEKKILCKIKENWY